MLAALDGLIDEAARIRQVFLTDLLPWTGDFAAWLKAAESTVEAIFGSQSQALASFRAIYFTPPADQQFANDLEAAKARLLWYDSGLRYARDALVGLRYTVDRLAQEEAPRPTPYIFISHGGPSRVHVDSVRDFLQALGLAPVIVTDLPNLNLSVNEKVRFYMGLCAGGIALATLDDEVEAAKSRTRPNVENEIGMMQTMPNIGARIVYLKQDEVAFATNYAEKVWIPFDPSRTQDAYVPLARELRAFGFVASSI
jgi:predicted nucleotide-binding protein